MVTCYQTQERIASMMRDTRIVTAVSAMSKLERRYGVTWLPDIHCQHDVIGYCVSCEAIELGELGTN